jgi:hypothetical protein
MQSLGWLQLDRTLNPDTHSILASVHDLTTWLVHYHP